MERVQGSEHPNALATRYLKAWIFSDTGQTARALEAIEELIPVQERVVGSQHPNMLTSLRRKAQVLVDYVAAIDQDHPRTKQAAALRDRLRAEPPMPLAPSARNEARG